MEAITNSGKRLYDGAEPEKQSFSLEEIGLGKLTLRVSDFINNPLRTLGNKVQPNLFKSIIRQLGLIETGKLFVKYIDADRLEVFFCIHENTLLILSFGEFQPSRFMVNFLGAFNSTTEVGEVI